MTFASQDGTTPVLNPTVDWEVEIGSSSYELVTSSDGIYLADPQAYEGVVDAGETVAATARPSTSVTALAVPVSALITDAAGLYCVWVQDGPGFSPVAVEVGAGSFTHVEVSGTGIESGTPILANPMEILEPQPCRSS